MTKTSRLFKRIAYISAATVMSLSTMLALLPNAASAAQTQATFRSVQMTTSQAGASASYTLSFKAAQAYGAAGLKGIVFEFCGDSPIVDSTTCTNANSFSTAGVTLVSTAGTMDASGWAAAAIDTNRGIAFTKAAGNTGAISVGDTQTIVVSGITNPNANGTFYARIYTYASNATATGFTIALVTAGPGNTYLDYGGAAMSIASQITVTAKVQESITFCAMVSGTCGSQVGTAVALGSGGILVSPSTDYVGTSLLGLAHNATNGVIVRGKATTLTSTGGTIAPTGATPGSGVCEADSVVTTREQFGLRVSALGSGMTNTNYGCAAGLHAFNTTALGTGATLYGDSILQSTAPQDETQSTIEYMAKAATTTKAGVYTSTFTYIATGSY